MNNADGFRFAGLANIAENAPVQYGSNVKSTVSYTSAYQYLPYERMSKFFKDMFPWQHRQYTRRNESKNRK